MRRVVHLSDLHFGRDRPDLVAGLIESVNRLSPDLVAISGDLTQRARNSQFEDARGFIEALNAPVLCVPGNHDVPLDNMFMRLLMPWRRYRRWIGKDLEPQVSDDEMLVVGINTVNPLAWQQGWFSPDDIERVRAALKEKAGRVAVIVVHHPLEQRPEDEKRLMRGAERALDALAGCGADIVLSGHLHNWHAGAFVHREGRATILQVHAGTGLSTRLRGEENDFNLLTLTPGQVRVDRYVATQDGLTFGQGRKALFLLGPEGWAAAP
jgi:3',5'-cyclic AMP phosphodiesterase CpdA